MGGILAGILRNGASMYPTEWPKPSPTPINTLVLLGITILVAVGAYQGFIGYGWLIPLAVMLLIFAQGDRAIYRREKRNYDGWRTDIEEMLAHRSQDGRWERGVSFVKKGRHSHASRGRTMRKREAQVWDFDDDVATTESMTA